MKVYMLSQIQSGPESLTYYMGDLLIEHVASAISTRMYLNGFKRVVQRSEASYFLETVEQGSSVVFYLYANKDK